ncbi:hypothetical protein [Clostridium estertheticum]|uniref:hypothetical protein n=1 Tax=Clostridium estertheticum TaxID=238834 RepID=UPI001C0B33B3|nr:hypothetical protein [Clostridium estertheticum]MBU3157985.1 hypothetical protein [Clostridium estertheticum]
MLQAIHYRIISKMLNIAHYLSTTRKRWLSEFETIQNVVKGVPILPEVYPPY